MDQAQTLARKLAPELGGPDYWIRIRALEPNRWDIIEAYGSRTLRGPIRTEDDLRDLIERILREAELEGLRRQGRQPRQDVVP